MVKLALEGIRVLDFTWVVAGPVATRILADQGKQDEAAAKAELDGIRRDGRYLRDVY